MPKLESESSKRIYIAMLTKITFLLCKMFQWLRRSRNHSYSFLKLLQLHPVTVSICRRLFGHRTNCTPNMSRLCYNKSIFSSSFPAFWSNPKNPAFIKIQLKATSAPKCSLNMGSPKIAYSTKGMGIVSFCSS